MLRAPPHEVCPQPAVVCQRVAGRNQFTSQRTHGRRFSAPVCCEWREGPPEGRACRKQRVIPREDVAQLSYVQQKPLPEQAQDTLPLAARVAQLALPTF